MRCQGVSLVGDESGLCKDFLYHFNVMEYGARLRKTRQDKELTQEQLASAISSRGHRTTAQYVSMIEREYDKRLDGTPSRPDKKFVIIAAEILNDDVDEALMDADWAPQSRSRLQDDDAGLYSGLDRLPPRTKELAKRQIRAIIDSLSAQDDHDTDYIDT